MLVENLEDRDGNGSQRFLPSFHCVARLLGQILAIRIPKVSVSFHTISGPVHINTLAPPSQAFRGQETSAQKQAQIPMPPLRSHPIRHIRTCTTVPPLLHDSLVLREKDQSAGHCPKVRLQVAITYPEGKVQQQRNEKANTDHDRSSDGIKILPTPPLNQTRAPHIYAVAPGTREDGHERVNQC